MTKLCPRSGKASQKIKKKDQKQEKIFYPDSIRATHMSKICAIKG